MSEHDEQRGGSGCAIGCLLVLLVAPVLYVLSIGPAAFVSSRNPRFEWLWLIYYPLEMLAECWTPLEDALGWYVEMWM
jgi:hypothetical protein